MTFKALVPGPPQLGAMTARPYRVPLASDASPAAVIAQLSEEDHPGALWGDWFDGGLLIFRLPLRVAEPLNATDGFECLDDQPLVIESELTIRPCRWRMACLLGIRPRHDGFGVL